jgi:Xaa-Pro aminopeptidase
MAMVKPGAYYYDIHEKAVEMFRDAGYGDYFFHGLGHWVGLQVHDVGDRERKLEPGMVLTIEPGLYIAERRIGVRIEDEVLVTKTGYRLLTEALPREAADIEELMRGETKAAR